MSLSLPSEAYNALVLTYFFMVDTLYTFMIVFAFWNILRYLTRSRHTTSYRLYSSTLTPPVSVLMPAYNEAATISESVRGISLLRYPEYEIIVINDGSTDRTLAELIEAFKLKPMLRAALRSLDHQTVRGVYGSPEFPNLVVVDKANGGKADALNAGIALSRFPLFCAVDADSLLQEDALERIVQPFIADPSTVAAGGFIRVVNGCTVHAGRVTSVGLPRNLIALFQIVEYLRAFYLGRMGWNPSHGLMIIAGAFGVFHTGTVIAMGGYLTSTVGEDMELVMRLHRHMREQKRPYRIAFVPESVCWTEVPESMRELGHQRNRWHQGLLDTLIRHRRMMLNPRYGGVGMIGMPYFWLVEVLGPLVELMGYLMIPLAAWSGILNWFAFQVFMLVSILFGILVSVSAVLAEEISFYRYRTLRQLLVLFAAAVLENLGYRQITNWWRLKGIFNYLRGARQWGEMQRKGFAKAP